MFAKSKFDPISKWSKMDQFLDYIHSQVDQNVDITMTRLKQIADEGTLIEFSRDHPSWRLRNEFEIGSRWFETFRHCPPWAHSRIIFGDFEQFWSIFIIF